MLANLDIEILRAFNRMFLSSLNFLFILIDYSIYFYAGSLLCLPLIKRLKGQRIQLKQFTHLLVSLIIGILLVFSLKYSINRVRPYEKYSDIKVEQVVELSPSIPSFHTFISFLTLHFIPRKPKWLRYFSIVYLVVLIPVGLMYRGVHYPSDVLVGAILGWFLPIIISKKSAYKLTKKILNF